MFSLISDDNQLASLRASVDQIRLSPPGREFSDPAHGSKSSHLIRASVSVNSMPELAGKNKSQKTKKKKNGLLTLRRDFLKVGIIGAMHFLGEILGE